MNLATQPAILSTTPETISKIKVIEEKIRARKQIEFATEHVFHAGMYSRTVRIPAGVLFTNVLIKCPTLLIIHGEIAVSVTENEWIEFNGYNVCPGSAGRKQIYMTLSDVEMTMIFPTNAKTVEEAEAEFTDEADMLLSRSQENDIVRTCLE